MTWTKITHATSSSSYEYGTQPWGTSPYGGGGDDSDWTNQDKPTETWTKQSAATDTWTDITKAT